MDTSVGPPENSLGQKVPANEMKIKVEIIGSKPVYGLFFGSIVTSDSSSHVT